MKINSIANSRPATSPAPSVPSRTSSGMPRTLHQVVTISAAAAERIDDWIIGGMSWIAILVATWLNPHDKHNTTTIIAASGSSGRAWWDDAGDDMRGGFLKINFTALYSPRYPRARPAHR